jgi:hypothetical protein
MVYPYCIGAGTLGPERSTYGGVHSAKGRTGAPIGLHMWYRGGWTYKRVGLRGRREE